MSGDPHPAEAPKEMAVSRDTAAGKKRVRPFQSWPGDRHIAPVAPARHHVSTKGRRFPLRGAGSGADRKA